MKAQQKSTHPAPLGNQSKIGKAGVANSNTGGKKRGRKPKRDVQDSSREMKVEEEVAEVEDAVEVKDEIDADDNGVTNDSEGQGDGKDDSGIDDMEDEA
jgi:hypothetical protein